MNELPAWVKQFNDYKLPEKYLKITGTPCNQLKNIPRAPMMTKLTKACLKQKPNRYFTHKVGQVVNPSYKILAATPYGNTFTLKFAEGVVLNEHLGSNTVPDFLAVSSHLPITLATGSGLTALK